MKNPQLIDVENIARKAGEILRAGYGQPHQVTLKGVIDPVTEIDKQSEDYILGAIREKFPEHGIVAEESGGDGKVNEHKWYVDPLDGTVNFAHDVPVFCVSIGYAYQGELVLGVVYDPMRDECFSAQKDKGAWLNGERIQVSAETDLGQSLLVTGFPYDTWDNPNNNLDNFRTFSLLTQAVRRFGSAALDLCYVAVGRFDGYWELNLEMWDLAAGALIVAEAGGKVTKISGASDIMQAPLSVVAANAHMHKKILEVLKQQ